jgi:energy-converting hydrogenase Eha subunit E
MSNPYAFFLNLEMQTIALLLLAAYYKILNGFPYVAVGALLLYVGSYQVGILLV